MDIEARLQADLREALRSGDEDRKRTLRSLLAALHNARIEARGPLDEAAQLAVLQRQARQRRESIAEYSRGQRPDLVAREEAELAIIESYLPGALSASDIEAAAKRMIEQVGAQGPQDLGRVMGPLMKELAGRADGKEVNAIVRRLLGA